MAASRAPVGTVLTTSSVASEVSMLFRTKRVSEIRSIESKIRADAEEKSDSLRELLGTRYKDLLEAADEMTAIRDACSVSVRDALGNMAKSATVLREHFLRKSGRDAVSPAPVTDDLERRKNVHVIGSKLKHIVDSPEVLYAHLEASDVYEAAVRYALASRNYVELRDVSGVEGIANRFAAQRWRQVEVFRDQILAAAEKKLVTSGFSSAQYSSVFAALIILAGDERDILGTMNGMLASRTGWIDDANFAADGGVAVRLRRVAATVRETISCMADILWSDKETAAEHLLCGIDDAAVGDLRNLRDAGELKTSCVKWISDIETWLDERGPGILVEANTSRALVDTLRSVDDVLADESWSVDCLTCLEESPKFVLDIFTPFISKRAAVVASKSVERAVDKVVADIEACWDDLGVSIHAGKIVWSTISSQAVSLNSQSIEGERAFENGNDATFSESNDVMRILACTGNVSEVVDVFESSFEESLADVNVLAQRVPEVSEAFSASVQNSLPKILTTLREYLRSIPKTLSSDEATHDTSCNRLLESALFVARTSTAISRAACVSAAYEVYRSDVESEAIQPITRGKKGYGTDLLRFDDTARDLWQDAYRTWANRLCLGLRMQLQTDLECRNKFTVASGWTSREGLNTDGESFNSTASVRHPTTASTALMQFLLSACSAANRAGGFALPNDALVFLREEMSNAAVVSYRKAIEMYCNPVKPDYERYGSENLHSAWAILQMLFDVLALQTLCAGTVSAPHGNPKNSLRAVEQQLNAAIDPIDLASCKQGLQDAVVVYLSRTSTLFGIIASPKMSQSSTSKRPLVTVSTQAVSSNLVSLSKTVPRFTYLPAPMPSTYSATGVGTTGSSAKASFGALRSEASAPNSGAYQKREADISVADYASKVSESVGRLGRGFFESWTRKVG